MDRELEKNLVESYPSLYRDYGGDIRQTCMGWGFACGDGWYNIIDKLSYEIKKIDKKNRVVAIQVKEKFGGLRFYYHIINGSKITRFTWNWWVKIPYKIRSYFTKARQFFYKTFYEKIEELVNEAEIASYKICEKCGNPGKRRGGGWILTLCDPCEEIYKNSKQ